MDIKDWILVGGGLLLIAVIGHGFWLAWRSRRDTLKIDIDPNIPRGDFDDLDLLRAELPNGGARVRTFEPLEQTDLALEPVVGTDGRSARTSAQADRRAAQNHTASRTGGAKRSESPPDRAGTAARSRSRGGASSAATDPDTPGRENSGRRSTVRAGCEQVDSARSHRD